MVAVRPGTPRVTPFGARCQGCCHRPNDEGYRTSQDRECRTSGEDQRMQLGVSVTYVITADK